MKSGLNHITINVGDFTKSAPLYRDLFKYLGYTFIVDDEKEKHLGVETGNGQLWLRETREEYRQNGYHRRNTGLNHLAFGVATKEEVDKFYNEFMGPRGIPALYNSPKYFPEYTPTYYAVYFEDPDRIKLEVIHLYNT